MSWFWYWIGETLFHKYGNFGKQPDNTMPSTFIEISMGIPIISSLHTPTSWFPANLPHIFLIPKKNISNSTAVFHVNFVVYIKYYWYKTEKHLKKTKLFLVFSLHISGIFPGCLPPRLDNLLMQMRSGVNLNFSLHLGIC